MTAQPGRCAHCGNVAAMGTLLAFTQAPGRRAPLPGVQAVVIRIVETPDASYLDARGAAWLRRPRQNG